MSTALLLPKVSDDALTLAKKSITLTETSKIIGCQICNCFPSPSIQESHTQKLSDFEKKCAACGTNCGKPALLDLFCGAGGAARGYQLAGFCVFGVDINPQPHYIGCGFHQADALEYLAAHGQEFDAIHASPPCQHYSAIQHITKNKHKHPDLVDPTRQLLIASGKPYVIENVVRAPVRVDLMLCGSMFGLGMIRHRIFESNIPMPLLVPTCHHENVYDPWHYGTDQLVQMSKGMGIDWMKKREEVREAIPPAYTEFIGRQLLGVLQP